MQKKITKSPIGKAALLGGLGAWGLGAGPFANLPGQGFLKGNFMKKMLLNKAKEGGWEATKWKLANVAPWKATAGITSIASIPLWAKPTNWDEMDEAFGLIGYRGPDNTHYNTVADDVLFAFHRLSIMGTTEAGNQPMKHPQDESLTLICNGEIYNYIELRKNLEKKSHTLEQWFN